MRTSVYDLLRPPQWVVDVLIVLVVAVPSLLRLVGYQAYSAYSLALIAPLLVRRVLPVLSFAAVSTLCLLQLAVIPLPIWGDVSLLVAVFSIARYGPRWARWGGLLTGLVGAALGPGQWIGGVSAINSRRDLYPIFLAAAVVIACWIFGDLRRIRAKYVTELEERAVRLALERDQQAMIAAAAERQRIAREMHDIVAHSLSVMVVQADGGRYAAQHDPEAAARVLETIASTGREALAEMRRLLGLLRSGESSTELAPQPGAGEIDELVAGLAKSGLPVTLEIAGTPAGVDYGTGLTLFRIVQEGLTNAIKHGGPGARAAVRLAYGERDVTVTVVDDGRGAATSEAETSDGRGHGLVGMRERVELHGGTLVARPARGGGFEVRVTLPHVDGDEHR
ncbi:MAG: sensor histidine kinase [Propionibacteriales bacterium]|nr:sensor histidine kinase [Propionibacteriales bacterium]